MMNAVDEPALPARDPRRRRYRTAVVATSVAAAVAGSVVLAFHDDSSTTTTEGVTATLRVPGHPEALAAGRDALWVALSRDGTLLRLDLATNASAQPVHMGDEVSQLTRAGTRLIAAVQHRSGIGQLAVLDWSSGDVLNRHWYDRAIEQTVVRGNDLWALEGRPGKLLRLDETTLLPAAAPLSLTPGRALGLAAGGGYLWVTAADTGEVLRIDPATEAIERTHVGGAPIGIVVAGGSVWVADRDGGRVLRLSPHTLRPVGDAIRVGSTPTRLVAAAGSLFVTDEREGTVVRIDLRSAKAVGRPVRVASPGKGGTPLSLTSAGQSVWVSSLASNTLNRIDAVRPVGKVTVRIAGTNKAQKGDRITNGGATGSIGRFVASGAISDTGQAVAYRTVKGRIITLRFVTTGSKGTLTFVVRIDPTVGTSHWTIASATKAYAGLYGEGTEKENTDFTVSTLSGTLSR
jgi:streptogramin lyase